MKAEIRKPKSEGGPPTPGEERLPRRGMGGNAFRISDFGFRIFAGLVALLFVAAADDPPTWTQVKAGEFPAPGTGRAISGELIGLDHVNRTATLRPDRNDSQRTDDYDIAMPFALLPYGKVMVHG